MPQADTLATQIDVYWDRAIDAATDASLPDEACDAILSAIGALKTMADRVATFAAQFNGTSDFYLSADSLTENWADMAGALCAQVETMAEKYTESRTPEARAWAAGEERAALAREGV